MTVWDAMIGQPEAVRILRLAALEGRAIVEAARAPREAAVSDSGTDSAATDSIVTGATVAGAASDSALSQEVRPGALSHAWLITGPPGSGRSVAARCLAAALQCTGEPIGCGMCPGCHTTMQGTNPDVQQYATEKRIIEVKAVRDWVARSYDAPAGGRWRISVAEDADRIAERTAGVLLKAVEEPPARGIWVLCAPTLADVIPTIRSRCRHVALVTPSVDAVAQYLAEAEGVDYSEARRASALAQSHVGVARALLRNPQIRVERTEAVRALVTPSAPGSAVVAADRVFEQAKVQAAQMTQARSRREREDLARSLGVKEGQRVPPALRAQMRALEEDQKRRDSRALQDALDRTFIDLMGFYRDVLVVQLGSAAELVNADIEQEVREVAQASSPAQTLARTDAIDIARANLQTQAAPQLIVEALAVRLATPRLVGDFG